MYHHWHFGRVPETKKAAPLWIPHVRVLVAVFPVVQVTVHSV